MKNEDHRRALVALALAAPTAWASDATEAAKAVKKGPDAIRDALAKRDPGLNRALLDHAGVVESTTTTEPGGGVSAQGRVSALDWYRGCHARFASKHVFRIPARPWGAWVGTQRVVQNGYCWRAGRIRRDSGISVTRTAAVTFCWDNTSQGNYWLQRYQGGPWITPDKRRGYAQGTLGNVSPLGCLGLTPDRPTVTYDGFGARRAR